LEITMPVKHLFPQPIFMFDLLDEKYGMDESYFKQLQREINEIRKNDPIGRRVSNADTGWQSNDGIDKHPAFIKLWNGVQTAVYDEIWPYWGLCKSKGHILDLHNSWANINDKGAWNKPHKHNGCWLSGALYVQADGDEGSFIAMSDTSKVMGDFPNSVRVNENEDFSPRTGMLFVFLSGLTHMVEPNLTDKERFSISFNAGITYRTKHKSFEPKGYNPAESLFEISTDGNISSLSTGEE